MNPVNVFAVVVRTVGLLVCLGSGMVLFWALLNLLLGGPLSALGLTIINAPTFGVGLWLLRGAPSVVSFAFPEARSSSRD